MLLNNIKSLVIHILISASAFYYTLNPSSTLSQNIYLIILISSLVLYYMAGNMFLEDQLIASKNLLSVSLIPLIGTGLWLYLFIKYTNPSFSMISWTPYFAYVGYTTPLIYKYIQSSRVLPLLSWIPAVILFFSIKHTS